MNSLILLGSQESSKSSSIKMISSINGSNFKIVLTALLMQPSQANKQTKIQKVWDKFSKEKKVFSEWKWWVKESTTQPDQSSLPIQVWIPMKSEFQCLWPKSLHSQNTLTNTIFRSFKVLLLMEASIQALTSLKKTEK